MTSIRIDSTCRSLVPTQETDGFLDRVQHSFKSLVSPPYPPKDWKRSICTGTTFSKPAAGVQITRAMGPLNYQEATPSLSPIEIYNVKYPLNIKHYRDRSTTHINDSSANKTFQFADEVDLFARTVFKRRPVDSPEQTMTTLLHHTGVQNNAFWSPHLQAVICGDTDPDHFTPFNESEDVIKHAFGHAIVEYAGGLKYQGQSGALDESIADIIAVTSRHYKHNNMAASANWNVAPDLLKHDGQSYPLRSMSDPGSAFQGHTYFGNDSQVKHMDDYLHTYDDHGGVHTNSGIPNHAFYLAATKEGGGSWDKMGKVWLSSLESIDQTPTFAQFAATTLKVAHTTYDQNIVNIIAQSWDKVGVDYKDAMVFLPSLTSLATWPPTAILGCTALSINCLTSKKPLSSSLETCCMLGIYKIHRDDVIKYNLKAIGLGNPKIKTLWAPQLVHDFYNGTLFKSGRNRRGRNSHK